MMLPTVTPLDAELIMPLATIIDRKAKPPLSLGRIEELALQLGRIAGDASPRADRARLLIFAGDHGLTEEGVSSYPSSVTTAMVATFLAGKASASAFARAVGAEVKIVDAGVAADLSPHPDLIDVKIRKATRNAAVEPAMTTEEASEALRRGAEIAMAAAQEGVDVLLIGEMGIGNSASAALLMHRLAPAPLAECVGAGAGHDAAGVARKLATLQRAAARSDVTAPLDVLAQFGGLEIAMMAGAAIGAAASRRPVIIDGFISSAAALAAIRINPLVRDYCIFGHRSAERGHRTMINLIGADPLLDLTMRLGEGTGALLALPLLRAASGLLNEVASLDDVLAGRL